MRRQLALPFDDTQWRSLVAEDLRSELKRWYDEAESCTVTATNVSLGTAALVCEREFTPLRWVVSLDRSVHSARLIDNTGIGAATVELFHFAAPTHAAQMRASEPVVAPPEGALLRATSGDMVASVVLPPNPNELRGRSLRPDIPVRNRSAAEATRLMTDYQSWASAALPAEPFALSQRRLVLRALTSALACMIAGHRWEVAERRLVERETPTHALEAAVGEESYQQAIAHKIAESVISWADESPESRSRPLMEILARFGRPTGATSDDQQLGEFLLRLASDPGSLLSWGEPDQSRCMNLALLSPVLVRAARYAVLALEERAADSTFSTFGGWTWM